MYKPLVSIVVNCFNGEKYLREALSSILKQTYSNWEVIFWDNQSSDNSKKIFYEFVDKRFKYYFSEEHTSLYKGRNEAIKRCKGDIIAFLDTDDWWNEDKLEKQVSFFQDDSVGLAYSNCYLFYENSKKKKVFNNKILKSGYITKDLFKSYDIGILTVLLRKKAYDSALGFNDQYNLIGDFDLFIRVSLKWKISCIQEPLACYRIHNKNYSHINNTTEIKELESWISDDIITSNKDLRPHLKFINERIVFLKTIKHINNRELIKAIKNIFSFPLNFNKIKLILYIVLPKKFLSKLRRFH